jgi:hypothetical protein
MSLPMMWQHCVSGGCFRKHFARLEGRFDANFPQMLRNIKDHFNSLASTSSTLAKMEAAKKSPAGIWWNIIMEAFTTEFAVKVMTAMSHGKMEEVADEIDDDLMEDITASKMIGWFDPTKPAQVRQQALPRQKKPRAPKPAEQTDEEERTDLIAEGIRRTYPSNETVKEMIDAATAPLLARIAELEALIKKPEAPAAVDPITDDEETRRFEENHEFCLNVAKKQKKEKKLKLVVTE